MISKAIRFSLVFLVVCGLLYPLATTGLAKVFFPRQAEGSLIRRADGTVIGSELIGQAFTTPGYFHGRVSSVKYDAAATGGSNAGPTDEALAERVKADVAQWQKENPGQPVPSDLLTNSGSGVDPHISPEAALAQVARVSQTTGIPVATLKKLVEANTEGRTFGLFGEPRVNVLKLNLAAQNLKGR
ncbi:MAG TPA: potassium-transporting ATPase subunit KdpC [Symbiobacteriaceae bacterium]|jgi:K+-transporting ATPase ATPase C chain|nr:potassium-transporting ATPase subunit KdpC [Symbiobacteriaceae bacterium]